MNIEKYTERARGFVQSAQSLAMRDGHQQFSSLHMLKVLLDDSEGLAGGLIDRAGGNSRAILKATEDALKKLPKVSGSGAGQIYLAPDMARAFDAAEKAAEKAGDSFVTVERLLLGLTLEKGGEAGSILAKGGVTPQNLNAAIEALRKGRTADNATAENAYDALKKYARDLTQAARDGKLDPVIGRDEEIRRTIQVLSRRTKNNPVLIGEPGVGKTAIVEGLAQRIVAGDVPPFLRDKRIVALDLSLVVAGTKYRGQFEERLKTIMRELIENPHYIIFIDELHTLVGAGSAEGSLDAANILKPSLSRGEIQCIGATTPAEFRKSIEKDRSLERRFQAVKVPPPTEEETIKILEGVKERYESFHQIRYTVDAVETAVIQSQRYIPDRFLPDKAIDIIDEAGARVKLREAHLPAEIHECQRKLRRATQNYERAHAERDFERAKFFKQKEQEELERLSLLRESHNLVPEHYPNVTRADIEEVISRWTGIPITSLKEEETAKLLRTEEELHKRIISQARAISALSRAIRRSRAGLKNPNRPVGSFLFLGPTGVGKTEVARSLAEFLFGSEHALIRFDMSEYMEKHAVSKLIGSPPGYVGHEEGGQLTEKIKRSPYSVLLLDEIEKAHPDLFNILLQVLEDGVLTDSLGNHIDFKNVILIMTSNIGARFIQKRGHLGFQSSTRQLQSNVEEGVMQAVKQTFNPEFINRLDEIIVFEPLTDGDLFEIVGLLVAQLNRTLIRRKLQVQMTPEARQWLVERTCTDRSYGARPLRRALQKYVEDPLSDALISGRFSEASVIEVYLEDNALQYRPMALEEMGDALLVQ
ncbi:MAG TPA: AAA family ATPase [Blastocatellia bacterium]|nr:AAA family ATPase [Blastocatellia bacterium]